MVRITFDQERFAGVTHFEIEGLVFDVGHKQVKPKTAEDEPRELGWTIDRMTGVRFKVIGAVLEHEIPAYTVGMWNCPHILIDGESWARRHGQPEFRPGNPDAATQALAPGNIGSIAKMVVRRP